MIYINQTFTNNEELRISAKDWNVDFKQVEHGEFKFDLKQISLIDFNISYAYSNRSLDQTGLTPKNMKTFALLSGRSSDLIWMGQKFLPTDIAIFPENNELDALSKSGFEVFTISFDYEIFENLLEANQIRDNKYLNNPEIKKLEKSSYIKLHTEIMALFNNVRNNRNSIFDKYHLPDLLLSGITDNNKEEQIDNYNSRIKAVQKVREFINEFPHLNPSLYELCKLSDVSKRTLQYAFQEEYSVSPISYIKYFKLNIAYKRIKNTDQNISEIAVNLGFYHFGNFAAEFKKLFGILPSKLRPAKYIKKRLSRIEKSVTHRSRTHDSSWDNLS